MAGGRAPVLRAWRAAGAGFAGFRRASQSWERLAEPAADPGWGQSAGRAGPLPGRPDVGGLVETPVSETEGVTGFPQIVQAENYVIDHNLGDVINQSFGATEETFPNAAPIYALPSAYLNTAAHGVTVLAATGDSGVVDVELNQVTYHTYRVIDRPPSDPLVTAVGRTQLHLNAAGERTSPDPVWNDTYNVAANELAFGDAGPSLLATNGGVSSVFPRPAYQNGRSAS